MNSSDIMGWLHPLFDEWRHLVTKWLRHQDYLPAMAANISPTFVAIMASTILAVVITMCLTSGSKHSPPETTSLHRESKSRTKSILRKTTPVGKHFSKKTSFAEIPSEVLEQSAKLLQVPEDGSQKFKSKSPPPSPSAGSDIDLENDDLECSKLLQNARKLAGTEGTSRTVNTSNLTESDLQEEERIQKEQLAQIYTMLSQDQEKFGKMSYDDLKSQASLYQ